MKKGKRVVHHRRKIQKHDYFIGFFLKGVDVVGLIFIAYMFGQGYITPVTAVITTLMLGGVLVWGAFQE